MINFKSLSDRVFSFETTEFESLALQIFEFQRSKNPLYGKYLSHLGLEVSDIHSIDQIPFMPIEFFKNHLVKSGNWEGQSFFESSGTTGSVTSKHYFPTIQTYYSNSKKGFEEFYGRVEDYTWLALLPSYLERTNSGLVSMIDFFIRSSNSTDSGFYLDNLGELTARLNKLKNSGHKVILIGVTFALLDLAEMVQTNFPELIVMETGGMKGRREELVRDEVHEILKASLGVSVIHSEYGMTELFSQAYSKKEGIFYPARTMRVIARDINDPMSTAKPGRIGQLNVIDMANIHSCAFIETRDLGKVYEDGSFEVLGRMDNSDIRGCNLMLT